MAARTSEVLPGASFDDLANCIEVTKIEGGPFYEEVMQLEYTIHFLLVSASAGYFDDKAGLGYVLDAIFLYSNLRTSLTFNPESASNPPIRLESDFRNLLA